MDDTSNDVLAWLMDQPPQVAATLASRTALRAMVFSDDEHHRMVVSPGYYETTLTLFRANVIARTLHLGPGFEASAQLAIMRATELGFDSPYLTEAALICASASLSAAVFANKGEVQRSAKQLEYILKKLHTMRHFVSKMIYFIVDRHAVQGGDFDLSKLNLYGIDFLDGDVERRINLGGVRNHADLLQRCQESVASNPMIHHFYCMLEDGGQLDLPEPNISKTVLDNGMEHAIPALSICSDYSILTPQGAWLQADWDASPSVRTTTINREEIDPKVELLIKAIEDDRRWFESGNFSWLDLRAVGLWPAGTPSAFQSAWDNVVSGRDHNSELWSNWTPWLDARVHGSDSEWGLPSESDAEPGKWLAALESPMWRHGEENPKVINLLLGDWLSDLRGEVEDVEPEPQSDLGLRFAQTDDGHFVINELAGAADVQSDREAVDLHAGLKDTLIEAANKCRGHNQGTWLEPHLAKAAKLMGDHPTELRIGRFLQSAERCIKLSEALALELRDGEGLERLSSNSKELVVLLEAIPSSYWAMVNFDPALASRVQLQSDPHTMPKNLPELSVESVDQVLQSSVDLDVSDPSIPAIVAEMGADIDPSDGTNPRRALRYWETVRNFGRSILGFVWANKGKVSGGIAGLWSAAKFITANSEWLMSLFAGNPTMTAVVRQVIEWASLLPLA